jgi:hypothetical protein
MRLFDGKKQKMASFSSLSFSTIAALNIIQSKW